MQNNIHAVQYPVAMFSLPHIIFLLCMPPAALFGVYIGRKKGFSPNVLISCLLIAVVCEFEKIIFFAREIPGHAGSRMAAAQLPFNMCPFQIFLLLVLVMSGDPRKRKYLVSYMFATTIGGGFMAVLVIGAIENYHGLLDISTYRYVLYHAMLVFLGFYLYHSKAVRFDIKSYGATLFFAVAWLMAGIWLNAFFGWDPQVNFNFSVRPPAYGLPLLNLNNGWVAYIFALIFTGFALITLCYLPVIVREVKTFVGKLYPPHSGSRR